MSMENLTKLVKVLGYTTSANDNEALNACRRANELMKSMNITWEQLVKDKSIVVNEIIRNEAPLSNTSVNNHSSTPNIEIEMMLRVCMSRTNFPRMGSTGQAFIRSLDDWYKRNHSLTQKQVEALRRWYNNV